MKRIDDLREKMRESELDAILIYDELSARYITDFYFSDGAVFITLTEAIMLTDFRYYEAALSAVGAEITVTKTAERRKLISEHISSGGIRRIGFEGGKLSHAEYLSHIEAYPTISFVDIGNMIDELRAVKDPTEIEAMRCAQEITDAAFFELLNRIKPEMTEIEVAAELDYLMRRGGAEGSAFDTIAVSGSLSAVPHGTPRGKRLEQGFLTLDFGAKFRGYCSDMTRTVVIGRADEEMRRLYNTVLSAQRAALDFLAAGVDCCEADRVARDIIDAVPEYRDSFGHSLGHSVGLYIHESPSLSGRGAGKTLRAGNVVTVEPGIYLSGRYGCRIEDMVLIKEGGVYNFTRSPKELIEIY